MDFEAFFATKLDGLHQEGRYGVSNASSRYETAREYVVTSFRTVCSLTTLSLPDSPLGFSRVPFDAFPAFTRN